MVVAAFFIGESEKHFLLSAFLAKITADSYQNLVLFLKQFYLNFHLP